jgi:hypothetical protein
LGLAEAFGETINLGDLPASGQQGHGDDGQHGADAQAGVPAPGSGALRRSSSSESIWAWLTGITPLGGAIAPGAHVAGSRTARSCWRACGSSSYSHNFFGRSLAT